MGIRKYGVVDFDFYKKHQISKNALFLMIELETLSTWARAVVVKDEENKTEEVYYYLTISKILEDIPMLSSKASISRALGELEEKEIIESVNKNTNYPAYRLTEKGKEWGNFTGETKTEEKNPKTKNKKLTLPHSTRLENLSEEYKKELQEECFAYSQKNEIDYEETFQAFVNWHKARGTRFVNWLSVYHTWCNKAIKDKKTKPKDGEYFDEGGLYK